MYQALYSVGCYTSLSDLVILSGGLYLPCHQFVALTVRFAVDSVSTSLVNIKDLAVAKLLNICCCRITEHYGFLVIGYFKEQGDFPCIVNATYYCCQFLAYYSSELFAYCSLSPSSVCFSLGATPPDRFKLYSASYYLIFSKDTFSLTQIAIV